MHLIDCSLCFPFRLQWNFYVFTSLRPPRRIVLKVDLKDFGASEEMTTEPTKVTPILSAWKPEHFCSTWKERIVILLFFLGGKVSSSSFWAMSIIDTNQTEQSWSGLSLNLHSPISFHLIRWKGRNYRFRFKFKHQRAVVHCVIRGLFLNFDLIYPDAHCAARWCGFLLDLNIFSNFRQKPN